MASTGLADGPRILTTHAKKHHPAWLARAELLPGWQDYVQRTWRKPGAQSFLQDLRWAWRLFRASRRYDAVVTGCEHPALLFALMQRFLRFNRAPHIFIQWMWNLPEERLRRLLRRLYLRRSPLPRPELWSLPVIRSAPTRKRWEWERRSLSSFTATRPRN